MTIFYHIAAAADWQAAQARGTYVAASLETEGFIHCSWCDQILPVAETFYAGRRDLFLLAIEADRLNVPWRAEPPAGAPPRGVGGEVTFPHVYGALNLDAVVQALPFRPNADGRFVLPEAIPC